MGHICTPSSSIGSPSSGCVRPRWAPTANICTPWPSTPPTPPTADHHESTSSSALMPSLGPNHDMVMPSSICHYLSWHGHALIMPQRHDMVEQLGCNHRSPLCCSQPVQTSISSTGQNLLQHLWGGEKVLNWAEEEEEDGQGWVSGLGTGRHLISTPVGLMPCWPPCRPLIGWAPSQLRSHWLSRAGARAAVRVGG